MSQEIIFHPWIKFDFNTKLLTSHDQNRLTAVANDDGIVVVWRENHNTIGPNLENGKLICIILGQFNNIQQIQWIKNSNQLMIKDGDMVNIWDIFSNERVASIEFSYQIFFVKLLSHGWLIVSPEGYSILYNKKIRWKNSKPAEFVAEIPRGVILYPQMYKEEDDIWESTELIPNRLDRRIKRKFESDNDTILDCEVYYFGETELINLELEESHRHLFDNAKLIVIYGFENGALLISNNVGVMIDNEESTPVRVPSVPAFCEAINGKEQFFVVKTPQGEFRVLSKFGKLVLENLDINLKNSEILLEKVPPSFYLDYNQDLIFVRINLDRGLIWFPDYIDDQIFLDLFTREGSIFTSINRDRNFYIEVDENVTYLLDWRRRKSYPSGILYYRDILNPENEPIVLYDQHIESKRITDKDFLSLEETEVDFPIIIPEWHKLNLKVYTNEKEFELSLSLSQYYCLLEEWSKHEEVVLLNYLEIEFPNNAFIRFGNLSEDINDISINLEDICPLWTINEEAGLLAHISIDGFGYLLDLSSRFLLPIYNFPATVPLHLRLTNDGKYLIFTYFSLEETDIKTHPGDENKDYLDTQFPYINFEVHDIQSKNFFKKSFRFPHHLVNKTVKLEIKSQGFYLYCPSYTDIEDEMVCFFELDTRKFHLLNKSEHKRYWKTHSYRSPHAQYHKGLEFPLVEHPEIYREYTLRPSQIHEYMMIRKSDGVIISSANGQLQKIDQHSSSSIHSLEGTVELELPFYYNETMKTIFIDKKFAKYIKEDTRFPLFRVEELPSFHSIILDLTINDSHILQRISELITTVLENKEVHSSNGIAYESSKFNIYKSQLEIQQEAINTAIDFIRGV